MMKNCRSYVKSDVLKLLLKSVQTNQTCWSNIIQQSNIVGPNMFDPFEQHNEACWIMLDGVERCWMKFYFVQKFSSNIVQHFRSHGQNYAIILYLVLKSNIVGWCWIRLNTPASNTIQHWSNTVQHHLTMLNNVWPTCLIRLNGP